MSGHLVWHWATQWTHEPIGTTVAELREEHDKDIGDIRQSQRDGRATWATWVGIAVASIAAVAAVVALLK